MINDSLQSYWRGEKAFGDASSSSLTVLLVLSLLYAVMPFTPFREEAGAAEAVLALLGLWVFFRHGSGLRWITPVKLLTLSIIICVVSWIFMMVDHPGLARSGPAVEEFIDKFLFLFIAIALAGDRRHVMVYLGAIGVAILLIPWTMGEGFSELKAGFAGERTNFGLNPIRVGLLFGMLFLGLVCLGPRFVFGKKQLLLRFSVWLVLVVFSLTCLITSQTRSAWLALIPAIVVGISFFLNFDLPGRAKAKICSSVVIIFFIILGAMQATGLSDVITKRFGSEMVTIERVYQGNLSEVPDSSWGLRVQMLVVGAQGFLERPLTGWGYHGGEKVLDRYGDIKKGSDGGFGHLHNSYLEILVSYGVGGLLIFLGLLSWGVYVIWKLKLAGFLHQDMYLFLLMALTFYGVAIAFDDDPFTVEGVILFNTIFGILTTYFYSLVKTENDGPLSNSV